MVLCDDEPEVKLMKNKILFSFVTMISFLFVFSTTAYANSSWHWVSATRPLDLLPLVIIITLLIEVLAVNRIAKVKDLKKVIPVVSLANLVSFLVPYLWWGITPESPYSAYWGGEFFDAINHMADSGPHFTVSVFYLAITLLVETPIVYLFFRKRVPSKRALFWIIIAANVLTMVITFAVERIFCHGEW